MKVKKKRFKLKVHKLYDLLFFVTAIVSFVATLELFNFVLTVNAKQVVISDDNLRLTYETSHRDIESFLKANKIVLGEYDKVNVNLDEKVEDGMFIEIIRAANVNLTVNGVTKTVQCSEETVEGLLKQEGIVLSPIDDIKPSINTALRDGLNVDIKTYTTDLKTVTEPIPYNINYKNVSTLNKGDEEVETEGKDGIASVTYKIKYLNGVEVSREVIDYVTLSPATDEVILRGVLETYVSPEGKTYKVKQVITMNSTAYTNSIYDTGKEPGHPLYGITRSGMKTRYGVVAVDPTVIPLMTNLYVEGYGEAIAADTGSAIKGNKIDLFYDTREEALKYGRKNITVYVLAD